MSKAIAPAFALMAWAGTPTALWAAAEESGGGGLFSINVGLSIWTVVVFLALVLVLRRYAWGPIMAALEAREKGIQDVLDEAARARDEAAGLLEEHRQQLAEGRRQAQQIVAEGRAAGEQLRREIEEKARQEGQSIIEGARREIGREKDAALDELRRESVDLALAAATRLLGRKLDGDADRELINRYLTELDRRGDEGAQA